MASELFPERDCAKCTDRLKEEWGCNGDATLPITIDDEILYTCIRRPLLDRPGWFNEIFTMYKMYKNGFLPNEGSYLAQPPTFLQMVNIVDVTLSDCEDIEEEENKRKERNKRRSGIPNG